MKKNKDKTMPEVLGKIFSDPINCTSDLFGCNNCGELVESNEVYMEKIAYKCSICGSTLTPYYMNK